MKNISASIVIPNYKRTSLLRKLLTSLKNIEWPTNFDKIIIVENGDVPRNKELVESFDKELSIEYLYCTENGGSPAKNMGAEHCTSEMIIFFDDDIVVNKKTLTAYSDAFNKHGLNHFYGGPLEPDYEVLPPKYLYDLLPVCAKGFSLKKEHIDKEESFLGANLAIPRKLFFAAGKYDLYGPIGDSNNGFCGEDIRLQQMLCQQGIEGIYVDNALVKHYVPEENCSEKWLLKRRFRQGYAATLKNSTTTGIKVFGVPVWIIKKILFLAGKNLRTLITKDERKDSIKTKMTRYYYLGMASCYFEMRRKCL